MGAETGHVSGSRLALHGLPQPPHLRHRRQRRPRRHRRALRHPTGGVLRSAVWPVDPRGAAAAAQQRGWARSLGRRDLCAGGIQLGEHGVLPGHSDVQPGQRLLVQRARPPQAYRWSFSLRVYCETIAVASSSSKGGETRGKGTILSSATTSLKDLLGRNDLI